MRPFTNQEHSASKRRRGFGIAIPALALSALTVAALAACEPAPGGGSTTTTTKPVTTTTRPVTTTTRPVTTTTTTPPDPKYVPGWNYVGGDEFDGTAVNTNLWKVYHNTYGDGNQELACLTPSNTTVAGGNLTIRSKKETVNCPWGKVRDYTSGFVGSREAGKYYPAYARFEMRAKVPHSQGLWPAFWLRHKNGASTAEVDIMEYFHASTPGKTSSVLHFPPRKNVSKVFTSFESPQSTPGWHTWTVEIEPVATGVQFKFFVDNTLVNSYIDTTHDWTSGVDLNQTWDVAINQAVGGNWTGDPDGTLGYLPQINKCAQGGTPPTNCKTTGINRVQWGTPSSTDFVVDYMRVYTR